MGSFFITEIFTVRVFFTPKKRPLLRSESPGQVAIYKYTVFAGFPADVGKIHKLQYVGK